MTASIGCGGNLENTSLWFRYDVVQFANGDVFTSGAIRGSVSQASSAQIFAPTQNGYTTAPVTMTFDVLGAATGGWWQISLNRSTLVTTILYTDSDVQGGSQSWTMTADKCVLNNY